MSGLKLLRVFKPSAGRVQINHRQVVLDAYALALPGLVRWERERSSLVSLKLGISGFKENEVVTRAVALAVSETIQSLSVTTTFIKHDFKNGALQELTLDGTGAICPVLVQNRIGILPLGVTPDRASFGFDLVVWPHQLPGEINLTLTEERFLRLDFPDGTSLQSPEEMVDPTGGTLVGLDPSYKFVPREYVNSRAAKKLALWLDDCLGLSSSPTKEPLPAVAALEQAIQTGSKVTHIDPNEVESQILQAGGWDAGKTDPSLLIRMLRSLLASEPEKETFLSLLRDAGSARDIARMIAAAQDLES